jgi:hypothetical protein
MRFLAKGTDKQFNSFSELVNDTTRIERNNLFGSAVVYKSEFDVTDTYDRIKVLIAETKEHLTNLETLANLLQADLKEAEEKKAIIQKLQTISLDKLKEVEELIN